MARGGRAGARGGLMCVPSCCCRERHKNWHKNPWKIHKGRWPASRTQLFTFRGVARNVESLFSKQPWLSGLQAPAAARRGRARGISSTTPFPTPTGTPRGSARAAFCPSCCTETWEDLVGRGFPTGPGAPCPASLGGPGSVPRAAVLL